MQKLTYFNVPSIIYNWDEYKRACNIDIYGTKNKLEKEYHILFFHTNNKIHKLFNNSKLEFFLKIDMLTYLPFEKLGNDYLNNKLLKENLSVIEYKYNKIIKLCNFHQKLLDDELKTDLKTFLSNYYNDIVEINDIGLAIISLRLFHRFVTIMNFSETLTLTIIHHKIDDILNTIIKNLITNNLKEININNYLPKFDYNNKLNESMIDYLDKCLS